MSVASLGDVAEFIRGITFKPNELVELGTLDSVVCMRTKNIQKNLDDSDLIYIPKTLVKKDIKFLKEGDLLISTANSFELVGKACWVPKLNYPATAGGFISILRANEKKLDPRYLYHWVSNGSTQHALRYCGRQTTNISNMDIGRAKELKIPLPPLQEQKRIAAILDKADAIRRKRQQAIDLTDQLLRSVFLDMFGDPVTNPKGWELVSFGAVGQLDRGKSKHRPRNDPTLLNGDHPLIQTGDVANSGGYITVYKSTYSDLGLKQSMKWPAGTLCITIAANIANTGILEFDACFPDSIVGFKPNELVTVEYVQAWLGFLQKIIEDAALESAQKNINLEILRNLAIPLPDIEQQKKFSCIAHQVKATKDRFVSGIYETQKLFASLTQQAFSGELIKQTKAA